MAETTYAYGIRGENKVLSKVCNKSLFSGVDTVVGSGNQFYAKEDLHGDKVLAQVKTTKSSMFSLKPLDFKKLEANASRVDKIPVFVVNFSRYRVAVFFIPDDYSESVQEYLENNIPEHRLGLAKVLYNSPRTFHTINGRVYRGYFLEDFRQ